MNYDIFKKNPTAPAAEHNQFTGITDQELQVLSEEDRANVEDILNLYTFIGADSAADVTLEDVLNVLRDEDEPIHSK